MTRSTDGSAPWPEGQKSKVAVVPCASYNSDAVIAAIAQGVELLGGMGAFINPGDKVLLKPNLVRPLPPEQHATTHPAVFSAVAQLLREFGCKDIAWGDSPGGTVPAATAAKTAGIIQAAEEQGVTAADFSCGVDTPFPRGRVAKNFNICPGIAEADAVINLCKLKTHQLERITGAVKNTFGAVYGTKKAASHVRHPDPEGFAEMLIALNHLVAPRLHIMDAIVAMEGNGPSSGDPVEMQLLLISADPVAVDSVACSLIHLNPTLVPTNTRGRLGGLGTWREDELEILTPEGEITLEQLVEQWGKPDFRVQRQNSPHRGLLGRVGGVTRAFTNRPYIQKNKCTRCGECVRSCPVGQTALSQTPGEIPKYHYKKCIRCYCCQELCPAHAINVR